MAERPAAYDIGDLVRCEGHFKVNGVSTDPTGPVVKYWLAGESETTKTYPSDAEVIKDSTGRFHIHVAPDEAGTWYYRWIGTGAAQAAGVKSFIVREIPD